jgi:hypothetical protein
MAAIKAFGLSSRTKAEESRAAAVAAMDHASKYSAQHVGAGMAPTRARLREEGLRLANEHESTAQAHDVRGATAEKGYFLVTDDDARNPSFMRDHQSLIVDAGRHGLTRNKPA